MNNGHFILVGHKVEEVDLMEWAEWMEHNSRIVKQEDLPDGKWVSTVFLGVNHQFGKGKPLIFETMVFSGKSKSIKMGDQKYTFKHGEEVDMDRYSTWEEAEAGHKAMVKKWTIKK